MGKKDNLRDEQEILHACKQNDPSAQKILFDQYAGKLLGVCARYCPNMEDAKDALHEGFIKIFKQIDRFKGNSKLETWMTRIMINTAIDHFKKGLKYKFMEEGQLQAFDENVEITFDDEDEVKLSDLYKVISELPDGYRVIFNLYAIEGYTHKEIAQELKY